MSPSTLRLPPLVAPVLAVALWAAPARGDAPAARVGEGAFEVALRTVPERLVAGETTEVTLEVTSPEPPGPHRPLRASVNVGTLGEVRRLAPGRYEIPYRPPGARYPQVAIVAVWREEGHRAPVAFFRVPLIGSARVPVDTAPGATVTVTVAGRRFGPFRANDSGVATARIVVPPGVLSGRVTATDAEGRRSSAVLSLDVPPYNRLTLAVVPHAIVADGVDPARLYLYYDAGRDRVPHPERMEVAAALGTVGPVQALAEGAVYQATFTAPPGVQDESVRFEARVRGDPASVASAAISLGRQVPDTVELAGPEDPVRADGTTEVTVRGVVLDAMGLGVAELEPAARLRPADAGLLEVRTLGEGAFEVSLRPRPLDPGAPPLDTTLEVRAGPASASTTLHLVPPRRPPAAPRPAPPPHDAAPDAWAEVGAGWRGGGPGLAGPSARVALGARVARWRSLRLAVGLAWGLDRVAGEVTRGEAGARPTSVRLASAPLLGEVRLAWHAGRWDLGVGAGAGILIVSGTRSAPSGGDLPLGALLPAGGTRAWAAPTVGPGRVVIEASWIFAGSDPDRLRGLSAVTGPGATLGYRLEL